jgi:endonuclease/exonuclease/phosphatase family metal-dependent hydrolase
MKRISFALFLAITLLGPGIGQAVEAIRIGSFNIAEFGEGNHPQTRDVDFIAKMLVSAGLDLIAIEEVGTGTQAQDQLGRLLTEMNAEVAANQPQYFFFLTPVTGDERYAVVYRSPVVLGDDLMWLDEDKDPANPRAGGKVYYRIPVGVPFSAGNFDFVVVIVHLSWGDLDRRRAEVNALRRFLREVDPSEDDWIVLGDTNRYGKFTKNATNKAFDRLLTGSWQARYRFPLLEDLRPFNARS